MTGGLGALGLAVSRWLVKTHPVRRLILVGRSAPSDAAQEVLAELRAAGATVSAVQGDITDAETFSAIIAEAEPALIVHAAGVLRDQLLQKLHPEELDMVMRPKVLGAQHIAQALSNHPTCGVVFFSSAAGILGSRGQTAYAAANAYLDSLAETLRAAGRQAWSIAYGPWAGGGMATKLSPVELARLRRMGIQLMEPASALTAMDRIAVQQKPSVLAMSMSLRALAATWAGQPPPLLQELLRPERAATDSSLKRSLQAMTQEDRSEALLRLVREEAARVLGVSDGRELDEERPLQELGLDSLMAVDLRAALSTAANLRLPATLVFDYPTVRALAARLGEAFGAEVPAPVPAISINHHGNEIAIIGMSCRLPGGVMDPASLWELLLRRGDATGPMPLERWDVDAFYCPDPAVPGTMMTRRGGFLTNIDQFDNAFFGITPREARHMDPQQRLLLEAAWQSIESAGYAPRTLREQNIGVYVGMMGNDYPSLLNGDWSQADGFLGTGNAASVASGRISYLLGLRGPSLTLDTACSSSLVAVHLAAQALRSGEIDGALVGGVTLTLHPGMFIEFSRLRALAPDGRCKSFSAAADGVAWAEGCGMVMLKRLEDARRDADPILAVIRGTAVNQDGRSQGLTAPNGLSQKAVVRSALSAAGVSPADVGYVETHGTGTPLGDPIEAEALGVVLAPGREPTAPVVLGAVKSNLGHTQGAAGVAGLIKAVLVLQNELIPANANFDAPSPHIDWERLPVRVADAPQPWPRQQRPRIAGVSSFGLSGTNAHAILSEAPQSPPLPPLSRPALVVLSTHTARVLRAQVEALLEWLQVHDDVDIHDVAHTLARGRDARAHRVALVVDSLDTLRDRLSAWLHGDPIPTGDHAALTAIGQRWASGDAVTWDEETIPQRRRVSLPPSVFQRSRHWLETQVQRVSPGQHPLLGPAVTTPLLPGVRIHEARLSLDSAPWLSDHRVNDNVIVPGTTWIDLALCAARDAGETAALQVSNVLMVAPLSLEPGAVYRLQVALSTHNGGYQCTLSAT
ncbi:MAG: 3-oxoacyl-(acyl-carrier-protein) synthase/NADP-dependent 3-hydroxy acid dehydrogenase YdfG, partial [Myxococcota bacterium]